MNGVAVYRRLPEQTKFRDEGCSIHSSCLSCPLPKCRYDEPGWRQREERASRDSQVLEVRFAEGRSVTELAALFGVSTRTVHRIMKRTGQRPDLQRIGA